MEKVMVVPADKLDKVLKGHGLITKNVKDILTVINDNYLFMPRDIAETNREVRQVIPYVVVKNQNSLYVLRRLKKQFEKRLHGKISLGVGGHINTESADQDSIILHSLKRELNEEINLESIDDLKFAGVINDLSTEVSWYHIGLLYILTTSGEVSVAEKEKMEGQWMKISDIVDIRDNMEEWSKISLDYVVSPEK